MDLHPLPSGNPGISPAGPPPVIRAGHTLYDVSTGSIDDPAVIDNRLTFTCPATAHGVHKPRFAVRYTALLADAITAALANSHDVTIGDTPGTRTDVRPRPH